MDEIQLPPLLDAGICEEIKESLDKIKLYEEETKEDKRKIEKLNEVITQAKSTLAKADEKKASLLKMNLCLKNRLEELDQRTKQALDYWKVFGLDVKEVAENHYEFIYTKLPREVTIGLKTSDNQLAVVSQNPELIDKESLTNLNNRLTADCVKSDNSIDYKRAMLMIKKTLLSKIS